MTPADAALPGARAGGLPWRRSLAALLALAGLIWAFAPGPNRFRDFDGRALGRAEAQLWRAYYEHRAADLALGVVRADHDAFGLSPWDSLISGINAAEAARTFQKSRSRIEAQAALPALAQHFAVVKRAARAAFDPAIAARKELDWWQLRRETDTGPDAYAPQVAEAAAYLYGADPARLREYARLRSAAMDLRDRKDKRITDADWRRISALLEQAYSALRKEVGGA